MALNLSQAEFDQIAGDLFLLKRPVPVPLPMPVNTSGANDLTTKLDPIKTNPRFNELSIGVVDFTAGVATPKIWLHREDLPWRTGSTGKIVPLLTLFQLRSDVRKVRASGLVTTPEDFDELFQVIWSKASTSTAALKKIKNRPPRISTIFDVAPLSPEFLGFPTLNTNDILTRLPDNPNHPGDLSERHLSWSVAKNFTPWERMWLTGAHSDNVGASTLVSEIGVSYMKAVQRAYGLFAPKKGKGMCLLLGSGYSPVDTAAKVNTSASSPNYRSLTDTECNIVTDVLKEGTTPSQCSTQSGSAAALTAYMIALMQEQLVGPSPNVAAELKKHLGGGPDSLTTFLVNGIRASGVTVSLEHSKIGILGTINCEFAYMETDPVAASGTAPAKPALKFAVIAMGIKPKTVGGVKLSKVQIAEQLGVAIFEALAAP
jgi:hypothetical protein